MKQGFFQPAEHPINQELKKITGNQPWTAPSSLVNQYTKEKMFDAITQIDRQLRVEGNDSKKSVLEGKLKAAGVHLMQKDIEQMSEQGNSEIIKQFGDFLLGKSTYNVDPKYRRLVPWGQSKLYGPGIDEYVKGVLSKKLDFDAKIAMMRRSGYFPSDIEEAWFYFIFIVLQKTSPTDMYMKTWESFYPAPILPPHWYDVKTKDTVNAEGKTVAGDDLDAQIPKRETKDFRSNETIDPTIQLAPRYIGNQDGTDTTLEPFDQKSDSMDPTKDADKVLANTKDAITFKTQEQELIEEQAKSQTESLQKLTDQMDMLIKIMLTSQQNPTTTPTPVPPPSAAVPVSPSGHESVQGLINLPTPIDPNKGGIEVVPASPVSNVEVNPRRKLDFGKDEDLTETPPPPSTPELGDVGGDETDPVMDRLSFGKRVVQFQTPKGSKKFVASLGPELSVDEKIFKIMNSPMPNALKGKALHRLYNAAITPDDKRKIFKNQAYLMR